MLIFKSVFEYIKPLIAPILVAILTYRFAVKIEYYKLRNDLLHKKYFEFYGGFMKLYAKYCIKPYDFTELQKPEQEIIADFLIKNLHYADYKLGSEIMQFKECFEWTYDCIDRVYEKQRKNMPNNLNNAFNDVCKYIYEDFYVIQKRIGI